MPYPVLRISLPKCQVVSHGKLDYFNNLGSLVLKRLDKAVLRDFATRFFYKGEVIVILVLHNFQKAIQSWLRSHILNAHVELLYPLPTLTLWGTVERG